MKDFIVILCIAANIACYVYYGGYWFNATAAGLCGGAWLSTLIY